MSALQSCLFCAIAAGDQPSEQVAAADGIIAIKDKFPQAPVHVLVLPVEHVDSFDALDLASGGPHADLVVACLRLAQQVADDLGIADGYRIATNIGRRGGQAIPHLHLHVLGGRQLGHIDDAG